MKFPSPLTVISSMTTTQAFNNYRWRIAHLNHSRRSKGFTGEAYTVRYRNGDTQGVQVYGEIR